MLSIDHSWEVPGILRLDVNDNCRDICNDTPCRDSMCKAAADRAASLGTSDDFHSGEWAAPI